MKPVLMIAYHYPPEGSSSGVLRALKFSRYLPQHGWMPHVLTLREGAYPVRDETLKTEIPPQVTVHRTAGWDTTRHFAIRGRHLECMAIPDSYVSWLPFAVARGLRVIRAAGVEAMFSTSPKPTAHLIAAILRRRTGVRWVADFRDPWIEEGTYPRPGSLRWRIETRLEAAVVRGADRVTVTTPELGDDLRRRYVDLPADRIAVIYNGYDETDFDGPSCDGIVPRAFELIHAGMITPDYRDPLPLLRAVARLREEGRGRDDVRVVFLGAGRYVESAAFKRAVDDLGLGDAMRVVGRMSHRDSLRRLLEAAVLVVLQADDARSLIPAKVFEYLRVGRPILALTSAGATRRLLGELGAGAVADPASVDSIGVALRELYVAWKADPGRRTPVSGIGRFSRASQAAELARLLDHLPSSGVSSPRGCRAQAGRS